MYKTGSKEQQEGFCADFLNDLGRTHLIFCLNYSYLQNEHRKVFLI